MRQALRAVAICAASMALASPDAGTYDRLAKAQAALDDAERLRKEGDLSAAIASANVAVAMREEALGAGHVDVAAALDVLGGLYFTQGQYREAEKVCQRVLAIRQTAWVISIQEVALARVHLALVYNAENRPKDAEPLLLQALDRQELVLGKDSLTVATTVHVLANTYDDQGLYDRAGPLHERVLVIREKLLGKEHPDVASALDSLAVHYYLRAMYAQAQPLFERALAIQEAHGGKDDPDLARTLNNLGLLLIQRGMYGPADLVLNQALAINEKVLGSTHRDVGAAYNNLANLAISRGRYREAEPLLRRALAIIEATGDQTKLAFVFDNLGIISAHQGLHDQAASYQQRALDIREAALGKDDLEVAKSLSNLAGSLSRVRAFDQAEGLMERALSIYERRLGQKHPYVATFLTNLAAIDFQRGKFDRAKAKCDRALAIQEEVLGPNHPDVAISLHLMGAALSERGEYQQAIPRLQRALAIREKALGATHPLVADTLNALGETRLRQLRTAEALALFSRALEISEGRLHEEALDFSESHLASFLQLLSKDQQRLYALAGRNPHSEARRRLALTSALLFKGRSVEEATHVSNAIHRSLGPDDQKTFDRLRGLRTQLAKLRLDRPGQRPPVDYRRELKAVKEEGDRLEAELARRSAELRRTMLPSAGNILARVAAALPQDGALVELVDYTENPPPPGPDMPRPPPPRYYLALLLFRDGHTAAADLGPVEVIDQAAAYLRDLYANQADDYQPAAQRLYELVFEPLKPLLGPTRQVFIAPDGQLSLVSFSALPSGGGYLADIHDFVYLTSGRDLLSRPDGIPATSAVYVIADPDFGAAVPAKASAPDARVDPPAAKAERSPELECFSSRKAEVISEDPWARLPCTRLEAEAIKRLIPQARLILDAEATKERLLGLRVPKIAHIATHGFFLPDPAAPAGTPALGPGEGQDEEVRVPDPLLRSGLVMAGANAPGNSSSNSRATALELAGLDLWGTELVVLSACDSGRGDVKNGQGIFGLRRAFVVAGAETLVVSLWYVNDDTTSRLMESYYRNLLAGQGRAEALRQAMFSLRASNPHPHFWAPFITIGRAGPLRAFSPPGALK